MPTVKKTFVTPDGRSDIIIPFRVTVKGTPRNVTPNEVPAKINPVRQKTASSFNIKINFWGRYTIYTIISDSTAFPNQEPSTPAGALGRSTNDNAYAAPTRAPASLEKGEGAALKSFFVKRAAAEIIT